MKKILHCKTEGSRARAIDSTVSEVSGYLSFIPAAFQRKYTIDVNSKEVGLIKDHGRSKELRKKF